MEMKHNNSNNNNNDVRSTVLQPSRVIERDLGALESLLPVCDPVVAATLKSARPDGRYYIPVCEATFGGNEIRYVGEAMRDGWISSIGPRVRQFEQLFAEYVGVKHGVAVSNGTTAIQLALAALDVRAGDEVILPTFTMVATIASIVHSGATPVLVDVDAHLWQPDVAQIESKITTRTRAIIVVHLYGHPADMDSINEVAARHGMIVIEDAAEAHGASYKGKMCGGLSDCGTFSFYANKLITTGEGGMVVTNNDELASVMRTLRDHGFSKERHFWHKYVAYNFRLTNLQACLGVAQTEQLPGLLFARRQNAHLYRTLVRLAGIPGLTFQGRVSWGESAEWMVGLTVDEAAYGMNRDRLRTALAASGVETRTFFIPMHMQPAYFKQFEGQRYPVSEMLCRDGFYLPSASCLSPHDIAAVVAVLYTSCPKIAAKSDVVLSKLSEFGALSVASPFERSNAVYETMYGAKDTDGEVRFVDTLLVGAGVPRGGGVLADMGCGVGRHSFGLARLGYKVTGYDRIQGFLDAAKKSASYAELSNSVEFVLGCCDQLELGARANTYDGVMALFDVINYQVEQHTLVGFVRSARRALKNGPGGVFVFSSWYGPAVLHQRPAAFRQARVANIIRQARSTLHPNENRVSVKYSVWQCDMFDRVKGEQMNDLSEVLLDAYQEAHEMRYLFLFEVKALLADEGFELVKCCEWMTGKEVGEDTWCVTFVAKATR